MAYLPTKSDREKNAEEDDVPPKSIDDFVSAFPAIQGWSQPLIQYKKYWFRSHILKGILQVQGAFRSRADDVILATQPKCGTAWLKALAFTVTNRSRYGSGNDDHPLHTRNPQHLVPFIEIPDAGTDHTAVEALSSPRLLATHIPASLLPPLDRSCRIVYLCRDPRDALVSRVHFENKAYEGFSLSMDSAFSMFCRAVLEKTETLCETRN